MTRKDQRSEARAGAGSDPKSRDILASGRRVLEIETRALADLRDSLGADFVSAVDQLDSAKARIVCAGVGKSGHVARKIAATLASTGAPAQFVHPTEASHGDLGMIAGGDVVIALSRSGETAELGDLIHYCKRFSIPLVAITAAAQSTLGKAADVALVIPDAPEACAQTRAPTTSTTLMIALGDALAVALLDRKGFTADDFRTFHPGGKLGAMLRRVSDLMHAGDDLPVVESGAAMVAALEVLSEKGFGCLGIVSAGGALVGMVTDGDIRRLVATGRQATTIDEVMTRDPVTVEPDMLASAALKLMNEREITQILAVENARPVGVVHMHDLLKAGVS